MNNKSLIVAAAILALTACSQSAETYKAETANYDRQDQDSDGVINERDLCPDTEEGAAVDNDGCSEFQSIDDGYELMVFFGHDSSKLTGEFEPQLQQVADFMQKYPEVKISVEGYASASGSKSYNLKLSKRRAASVRQQLITDYAVPAERIELEAIGEEELLVAGDSEQSEAANRRARIFVQEEYRKVVPRWSIYTPHLKQ
ncbi:MULTISPECIES: OmpA family protein [unclassified Agarivorans]|uniref:OmpA family protein n=1 Tax=unclassified Agarivorans TaxID=2636026 RepID=UPI0010D26786|nr:MULTISPECIES: OmpA family protein [unclassified Agarivorans]MDO6687929.1 OmpA family protein [Agarivorans sp. 3_MG-2023]MDO6717551.1 OmpA family protein [Agarivorans sp. 2_MG-2023]MDO6764466.1 OmpA family protein [Agarivorans sp. 1_MG-2023]GDY28212.1 porin [Agarivorans sp. Toyoura001]